MCWDIVPLEVKFLIWFWFCSFGLTQKNQKVKAYYKFHTSVCITERLAKQGLLDLSGCRAWLKLVFCVTLIPLFILIRLSGEATAVVKFIIGRSLNPENCAHKPNRPCNAAKWKNFLRRDRPLKNKLAVLEGGMCGWHVRSNTPQRQMPCFVQIFHALYCEKIPPD
jgi:hypothetical protein